MDVTITLDKATVEDLRLIRFLREDISLLYTMERHLDNKKLVATRGVFQNEIAMIRERIIGACFERLVDRLEGMDQNAGEQ